jgi:pilus assembly protein CpaE
MHALLISDDDQAAARARQVLLQAGLECPIENVVSLALATFHLMHAKPELVVMILPSEARRGLTVLGDFRAKTQAHVLVIGPASDAKLVLGTLRAGADDYVDESELEAELEAVVSRWRAGRATKDEAGRLIAVLSPSGGGGSSTVAANVATVLAKEHGSAMLVDMKFQSGDLSALLDLKPTHTMADLCRNVARMDRTLLEGTLVRHASGVHLLASPLALADAEYVNVEGVRRSLELARSSFPYVVADLDHSFREEQTAVLRQADIILLVQRLDFASLRNSKRALDHLRDLGIDTNRLRLVVNRHGQPQEIPSAKAEEALEMKIAHFIPEDAKSVNRSNNNGVPFVLGCPSAKVSKSLTRLAVSVNGMHKKH